MTYCPLSRLERFQINERGQLNMLELELRAKQGGAKVEVPFPAGQREEVSTFMERRLSRRACYEVEKNLSRLAADWRDRITVAIEELRAQAERCARDELATLEQMLVQTNTNELQLREAIRELEAIRTQLKTA